MQLKETQLIVTFIMHPFIENDEHCQAFIIRIRDVFFNVFCKQPWWIYHLPKIKKLISPYQLWQNVGLYNLTHDTGLSLCPLETCFQALTKETNDMKWANNKYGFF